MSAITSNVGSWIRRYHPAPDAALRLVCFPHAGGSATFYFPVARSLAPVVDVLAMQYPGRQERRGEPCIDDINKLADLIADELVPWCDRPIALFGHSMGSLVAYEVGRRLERAGTIPLGLFASGRRAPSSFGHESIHTRDDAGIVTALRELSGTESALLGDGDFLSMVLPAVRGDYRAVETYHHGEGPRLTCPICVLIGDNDPTTTIDEAGMWRTHTTGPCQVEVFPGGHFYLKDQAQNVLATIRRHLGEWSAGST